MRNIYFYFFVLFLIFTYQVKADESSRWLKKEIDLILEAYQKDISNENRFLMIEETINTNFAGTGIAKFVAGESWKSASKETKKEYIKNFKRHLALNIASMMRGYSDQKYELSKSQVDQKNKIILIDMEIFSDTGSVVVTWRVKESKDKFFIIDLIVADISLVVTKRSEFNSLLKNVDYKLIELNKILANQNNESYQKIIN